MVRPGLLLIGLVSIAALVLWWMLGHEPAPTVDFEGVGRGVEAPTLTEARPPAGGQRIEVADETPAASDPTTATRPPHAVLVQLRGRVKDARSSRPLAGATITLSGSELTTMAADDGSYALEFWLAEAGVAVECAHADHLTTRRTVSNHSVPKGGRVEPFDFELLPRDAGVSVRGRIVDDRGSPVRGATVHLQPTPPTRLGLQPPTQLVERMSQHDGGFAFEVLHPGSWDLRVAAPGLEEHERIGVELPPGSDTDLGSIRLARFDWARLTGRVIDYAGNSVPNAVIRVHQTRAARTATSDFNGAFTVERIAPGTSRVDFECGSARGGLASVEFAASETVHREIVVDGGTHFVGGLVLLGDTPAANLEVSAEIAGREGSGWMTWEARTDHDGRFRINGLPPGRLDLGFTRQRPYAVFEATGIAADRDDHRFVFAAAALPVTITGVVRDRAGAPLVGATVTPFEPSNDAQRGRSGPDGRYRIETVLSTDMTNLVVVEHAGHVSARERVSRDMIGPQGEIALDFALSPENDIGTVEGIVTDRRGRALRDVECICQSGDGTAVWRTHSDSFGRFCFDDLVPGSIELHWRHPDYRPQQQSATLEAQGRVSLEIELSALERFARTIVVRGAAGESLPGVEVDVWRGHLLMTATTDAAGRATLRDVPDGAVKLSVEVAGYARHAMRHTVDGPREIELVFELRRGAAALEGVLVTSDGAARDDAEVIVTTDSGADTAVVEAITYSDTDGRFRVEHVPPGDYDVKVWAGLRTVVSAARAGGGPVRIVLDGR